MKIVHVINDLKGGGAQNLLVPLAIHQQGCGHSITVVVIDRASTVYEEKMKTRLEEANVVYMGLDRVVGSGIRGSKVIFDLMRILKNIKPDIVNTHLELTHELIGLSAKLLKYFSTAKKWQHVATIHNAPENWSRLSLRLNVETAKVYCSDAAFDADINRPHDWRVINNGITSAIAADGVVSARKRLCDTLGIAPNSKLVMSVGSIRTEKNYASAIKAISLANRIIGNGHEIHYLICGRDWTGSEAAKEAVQACDASSIVHFLGMRSDTRDLLNLPDCYLSASKKEGLPLALLEAMFAGLPCVLSPIKPHLNIASGIPGCVIADSDEPADLASALNEALMAEWSKQSLLTERNQYLKPYTIDECARKYLEFYSELAGFN